MLETIGRYKGYFYKARNSEGLYGRVAWTASFRKIDKEDTASGAVRVPLTDNTDADRAPEIEKAVKKDVRKAIRLFISRVEST